MYFFETSFVNPYLKTGEHHELGFSMSLLHGFLCYGVLLEFFSPLSHLPFHLTSAEICFPPLCLEIELNLFLVHNRGWEQNPA